MEDLQLPSHDLYFSREMIQEFHVAFAKREATRILKRVDFHKRASLIEKHLDLVYRNDQIVGS